MVHMSYGKYQVLKNCAHFFTPGSQIQEPWKRLNLDRKFCTENVLDDTISVSRITFCFIFSYFKKRAETLLLISMIAKIRHVLKKTCSTLWNRCVCVSLPHVSRYKSTKTRYSHCVTATI